MRRQTGCATPAGRAYPPMTGSAHLIPSIFQENVSLLFQKTQNLEPPNPSLPVESSTPRALLSRWNTEHGTRSAATPETMPGGIPRRTTSTCFLPMAMSGFIVSRRISIILRIYLTPSSTSSSMGGEKLGRDALLWSKHQTSGNSLPTN